MRFFANTSYSFEDGGSTLFIILLGGATIEIFFFFKEVYAELTNVLVKGLFIYKYFRAVVILVVVVYVEFAYVYLLFGVTGEKLVDELDVVVLLIQIHSARADIVGKLLGLCVNLVLVEEDSTVVVVSLPSFLELVAVDTQGLDSSVKRETNWIIDYFFKRG